MSIYEVHPVIVGAYTNIRIPSDMRIDQRIEYPGLITVKNGIFVREGNDELLFPDKKEWLNPDLGDILHGMERRYFDGVQVKCDKDYSWFIIYHSISLKRLPYMERM